MSDLVARITADSLTLSAGGVTTACGVSYVVTRSALPAFDNCPNNYTITWTITDSCGRTIDCNTIYTISNVGPVINLCPVDATVECYSDLVARITADSLVLSAGGVTTACGVSYVVTRSALPAFDNCPNSYIITWTVTDSCARRIDCNTTYTISNVGPVIDLCPADATVECYVDLVARITADSLVLSAGDVTTACGVSYVVTRSALPALDNCPNNYTITWTVTDSCGRFITCNTVYTISNVGPVIDVCPADATVECYADLLTRITADSLTLSGAGVTAACGMSYVVTRSALPAFDNCPNNYTITWTVTDSCGRTIDCNTVYTIDNVGPVINLCPVDATVECYSDLVARITADSLVLSAGGVTTACGVSYVVTRSALPAFDNCPNSYTITWTVTDSCGRTIDCNTVYTIDNVGPVIDLCPADATVECYSDLVARITADSLTLSAGGVTTACGVSYVVTRSALPAFDNCPNNYTITWTVTDSCGRTIDCNTVYTIDNVGPVIDLCPADATVECYADLVARITADSLALSAGGVTTACGVSYVVTRSALPAFDNCPNNYTITWTVTDSCGRTIDCNTVYTIDNVGPVIDLCPADATVECYSDLVARITADSLVLSAGGVTTACGVSYVVTRSALPAFDNCPNNYTITWTITDSCGRTIDCNTIYTIDNLGPVINLCPADATVECYSDLVARITADSLALSAGGVTTACGVSYVVTRSALPAFDNCPNSYVITWTVTDSCGRSIDCNTTYTISNVGPVIDLCPADATVECYPDLVARITADSLTLSAGGVTTACGVSYVVTRSALPAFDNCPNNYTITWTVTDSCGRFITCNTVYTISNVGPVIDVCPADATVECYADLLTRITADSLTLSGAGVTAACGMSYVVTRSALPAFDNCPNNYTITWTVTDSCGRFITCNTVYTISNVGPVIDVCPADATVECYSDLVARITADSLALSAGGVTTACGVSYVVTRSALPAFDNCPNNYTITWTVTDSCGRLITCNTVYTIDNVGPVIDLCPADATVECYSDLVARITADSLTLSAGGVTTACGVSYVVTRSALPAFDNCPNNYTITWTITDSCGRTIDCTTIYTIDNVGPVIDLCPADATVECYPDLVARITADSLALSAGGVTTACGVSYVVTRSALPAFDNCPNNYTITWTVTDSCGRTIDCNTIYTIDNVGPVIDLCPADATVECYLRSGRPDHG